MTVSVTSSGPAAIDSLRLSRLRWTLQEWTVVCTTHEAFGMTDQGIEAEHPTLDSVNLKPHDRFFLNLRFGHGRTRK